MVTNLAVKWDRNESTLPLNRWWRRLHWVRRRTSNQHITHPQHLWVHHWLFLMVLAIDLTWSNIGSVIKMQTREWNTHLLKWMNTISSLEANCYSKPLNHYLKHRLYCITATLCTVRPINHANCPSEMLFTSFDDMSISLVSYICHGRICMLASCKHLPAINVVWAYPIHLPKEAELIFLLALQWKWKENSQK